MIVDMIKVAMIGAGSVVFSKNLTGDILSFPKFRGATFSYMDIDENRLEVGAALCQKVAKTLGATPTIEATTDRRKALAGADFVINMVQIGGFDSTLVDFEIPRKYGLNFTIADTTGSGGLFRALRTYPMLCGLVADMTAVCPKAVLLNYSNPMSMNMRTITHASDIPAAGLCHSVQGTFNKLMRYIGVAPESATFTCAGINHLAFYQRLEKNGEDLYPRLFALADEKIAANQEAVRFELMKRLGYYVTESSIHNAEYNSFFIPRGQETMEKFGVPIDEYLRRCDGIVNEFERLKILSHSEEPVPIFTSHEYGSVIIDSITGGKPSVVYGNMPNNGAVSNLPSDTIVEVPTLVDRAGLRTTTVGALAPQLVGYMMPHVIQHELFLRAAVEGRRDYVYQACMNDPLTAATLPLDKIVEMCDELIAAHGFEKDGGFLPDLDAKATRVPTSGKSFAPPTPSELRASWDAAQKQSSTVMVTQWGVLGAFPSGQESITTAFVPDGVDEASLAFGTPPEGGAWRAVSGNKSGFTDLVHFLGASDYATAYAHAEVESEHPRDAVLVCGSDDGIKVWLNAVVVLNSDTRRGRSAAQDRIAVRLNAGVNHLLIKVTHFVASWGFFVALPRENY